MVADRGQPPRNPYTELGADVEADRRTIRGAYLAKARRHHPDLGGNAGKMARINEAFELLNDPARRAAYDAVGGHAALRAHLADRARSSGRAGAYTAAGATVAVLGTAALVRQARRRRRGH